MTKRIIETVTKYSTPPVCRTAAQMEQICCTKKDELPCCAEKEEVWDGYTDQEILDHLGIKLDKLGRDDQGRYVTIQRAARGNPCGEKVTTYNTAGKSCCEEVAAIQWDSEHSASVIADMSSAYIVVTGGRLPFNISVRGSGFYLDESRRWKDGTVDGRIIEIFTSTACGPCTITITDGCSTVVGGVRSTNGSWDNVAEIHAVNYWLPNWVSTGIYGGYPTVPGDVSRWLDAAHFLDGSNGRYPTLVEGVPFNYGMAYISPMTAAPNCPANERPNVSVLGFSLKMFHGCLAYDFKASSPYGVWNVSWQSSAKYIHKFSC